MSLLEAARTTKSLENDFGPSPASVQETKPKRPVSLSSVCMNKMVESKLFCPARWEAVHISQDPLNIDQDLSYDNPCRFRKRSGVLYQTHRTMAAVARAIGTIAIHIFVPVIGVGYHTIQHLRHRKCQELKDAHLKCLGIEGVRIALVALAVASVLFPSVAPLICLPAMAGGWEIGSAVYSPLYTFDSFERNEFQKDNWAERMQLKWYLGHEVKEGDGPAKELLDQVQLKSQHNILRAISELQRLLPRQHQLPLLLGDKFSVHKILLYLEESRKELINEQGQEFWDQIRPIRDSLVFYNDMKEGSTFYASKELHRCRPEEIENAFKGNGVIHELSARSLKELGVRSLTQRAYCKMLSSDLLYPSNVKKKRIENKGSIAESMQGIDPFPITSKGKLHKAGKPIRYVARCIALIANTILLSPIGSLYNGAAIIVFSAAYIVQGKDCRFGNVEKIKAYSSAFFNDLLYFPFGVVHAVAQEYILGAIANSPSNIRALYKAIALKNEFGITGLKGEILSYKYSEDTPSSTYSDVDRYFTEVFYDKSRTLALYMSVLCQRDPKVYDILSRSYTNFSHTGKETDFLSEIEDLNQPETYQIIAELLKNLKKIHSIRIAEYNNTNFTKFHMSAILTGNHIPVNTPKLPFCGYMFPQRPERPRPARGTSDYSSGSSYEHVSGKNALWANALQGYLKALHELATRANAENKSLDCENEAYRAIKAKITNNASTLESILDLPAKGYTHEMIKESYKKLSKVVHPDRLARAKAPELVIEEAKVLFQVIGTAKDLLLMPGS